LVWGGAQRYYQYHEEQRRPSSEREIWMLLYMRTVLSEEPIRDGVGHAKPGEGTGNAKALRQVVA
jgi:hypothetical protein